MQQIDTNSFHNILLDNLEHIIFEMPPPGIFTKKPYTPTVAHLRELLTHKFQKEYNLIYQNDDFGHGCDFKDTKKYNTDIISQVLTKNHDKTFMIINYGRFDTFALRQHKNCQVWDRKYFAPMSEWTHNGSRDESAIEKNRNHWFVSVLGRVDHNRSQVFNWIISNGLEKQNKVSYLCYGAYSRNIKESDSQKYNYIHNGGKQEYQDLIPFNNFEGTDIPDDNIGRINKSMPLYDCLFNIVVETYATNNSAFHTEKSLNTILYGHVPVVIGGEGSMKKLQDMGMIIPDYIQWSIWDDIPINELNYDKTQIMQRQMTALFSKHKIKDIAEDWYPYALRNFENFKNIKTTCLEEEKEICRWILTTTQNLSNREYQKLYQ